ncbi:MAG: AAA family ATPase [Kofleriaceae bacterium]
MTNDDEVFGYQDGSEQLADYAERFGLLVDRLHVIRSVMPDAAVVTEGAKQQLLESVGTEIGRLNRRIGDLDDAIARRAEVSKQLGVVLPLELLRERVELTQLDIELLTMLYALESGGAFNPYDTRSVTHENVSSDVLFFVALLSAGDRINADTARMRLSSDAPLVDSGLIHFAPAPGWGTDAPLRHKRLRIAERTLEFLSGSAAPPRSVLGTMATYLPEPAGAETLLLEDPEIVGRAARALSISDQLVVLRGASGVGRKSIAAAAARQLGRGVLVVDLPRLSLDPGELARTLSSLFREAQLQAAVLVLDRADEFADREGQSLLWPLLTERLARSRLHVALVCEHMPVWLPRVPRVLVDLQVPFPSPEIQHRLWVRHLPPHLHLDPELSIEKIVKTYSLSCASIIGTTDELSRFDRIHARGGHIDNATVLDVVRRRLAHQLGELAEPVRTTLDWRDVILSEEIMDRVIEFLNFARHRESVMSEMGFGRKLAYGRGLSALFSGPPGTGKTMICSLLAKELGMELYRIDLSQVVNKYIGETEKNLGKVFDEAARGQVILLFDEADAIFAKRTEVKSSHDRYANLEVNYLLQRMEGHEGIVVMTTNSENSIDRAFLRRIRFRVRFPAPTQSDRERLWRGMVPKEVVLGPDVDFGVLASRFPMPGGNIMNALVRAATSATAGGQLVEQRHLVWAAELEYSEMGFLA